MKDVYRYSVKILIKTSKEVELIDAVQRYMENASDVWFGNDYEPDSIENIARIFLADRQGTFEINDDGSYSATFYATDGWGKILFDWWFVMKPYLDDESYIKMRPVIETYGM